MQQKLKKMERQIKELSNTLQIANNMMTSYEQDQDSMRKTIKDQKNVITTYEKRGKMMAVFLWISILFNIILFIILCSTFLI